MTISMRQYSGPSDFPAISDFLFGLYQPDNADGNWFQPMWEYAYTHPWFDDAAVDRIGIWEDAGKIVAVVVYELRLGEAFFQVCPGYTALKPVMLRYAEERLANTSDAGEPYLRAYASEFDSILLGELRVRGYTHEPEMDRPMAQFTIKQPFPTISLAPGFRLKSLADENDLIKVDRVLWRGFDHAGEPPEDGPQDRQRMQSGPHFRHDLTIVVEAAGGDFVAFAGLWFDAVNRLAYVEPVATDPDYRRQGLGTAAVLEGIRRCAKLGATVAYVGSDQPFYQSIGFRQLYTTQCWKRSIV